MRARRTEIAVLGGLLVVCAGVAWNATRGQRVAEAALTALAESRKALEVAIGGAESRLRAVAPASKVTAGRQKNPETEMESLAVAKKNPDDSLPNEVELITNDPKLEVLELDRQRAEAMLEYGQFFEDAGLSSEQIAKFRDNRAKWIERLLDLAGAARAQDEAGQQTVARLKEQAKADYEARQVELLGAENYRRLQEYDRTEGLRNGVVRGLAGAAALAGFPLAAQQGDQLLQAAVEIAGNFSREQTIQSLQRLDWTKLDARARQILTPEQFALFSSVATPTGFSSRWKLQLDAIAARAMQADPAMNRARAFRGEKAPGGG